MTTTITLEDETFGDPQGSASVTTTVTVVDEQNGAVTEVETVSESVEVDLGVEGPRGQPGATPVPVCCELTAVSSYLAEHPFTAWTPEVWFVLPDGTPVIYSVTHVDASHVHVEFPTPFTGDMYIR